MINQLRLFLDADYRAGVIGLIVERGLPIVLGAGIIIIGVAFVLSGTKTGQLVSGATNTALQAVATKGKSLA